MIRGGAAATSGGLFTAPQGGGDWSQLGGGAGGHKLNMGGIESVVVNSPTSIVATTFTVKGSIFVTDPWVWLRVQT